MVLLVNERTHHAQEAVQVLNAKTKTKSELLAIIKHHPAWVRQFTTPHPQVCRDVVYTTRTRVSNDLACPGGGNWSWSYKGSIGFIAKRDGLWQIVPMDEWFTA